LCTGWSGGNCADCIPGGSSPIANPWLSQHVSETLMSRRKEGGQQAMIILMPERLPGH